MKISVTHKHNRITGVSTFLAILIKGLSELGHDVRFTHENLESPDLSYLLSISPYCTIHTYQNLPNDNDIIFFNYSSQVSHFFNYHGSKRFIVHGTMESFYAPPQIGLDKVFCLSERSYELTITPFHKILIRNFIDTEKFKPSSKLNANLNKILLVDYRNVLYYKNLITNLSNELKIPITIISEQNQSAIPQSEMPNLYNLYDLVIGYGRVIYEAMACGRACLVYGINGGDGYLNKDNFKDLLYRNCSGWQLRKLSPPIDGLSLENFTNEIQQYNSLDGQSNRELSLELDYRKYLPILIS